MNDLIRQQMMKEILAKVDEIDPPTQRRKGSIEIQTEILAEVKPLADQLLRKYELGQLSLEEANSRINRALQTRWDKAMKERRRDTARRRTLVGHRVAIMAVQDGMSYLEAGKKAGFNGDDDYIVKKVLRAIRGALKAATAKSIAERWRYLAALEEGLPEGEKLRFVINQISGEVLLLYLRDALALYQSRYNDPPK